MANHPINPATRTLLESAVMGNRAPLRLPPDVRAHAHAAHYQVVPGMPRPSAFAASGHAIASQARTVIVCYRPNAQAKRGHPEPVGLLGIGTDDHRIRDRDDFGNRQVGGLCMLANRFFAAGFVDANRAERTALFVEHI